MVVEDKAQVQVLAKRDELKTMTYLADGLMERFGRGRVWFSALLAASIFAGNTEAQGILSTRPDFDAVLAEVLSRRSSIEAGEFEYQMNVVMNEEPGWSILSRGRCRFDERVDARLHATFVEVRKKGEALQGESKKTRGEPKFEELGLSEEPEADYEMDRSEWRGGSYENKRFHAYSVKKRDITTRGMIKIGSQTDQVLTPFRFRSFGMGLYGNFIRRDTLEKSVLPYFKYPATPNVTEDDDLMWERFFTAGQVKKIKDAEPEIFNLGGYVVAVDPHRGYWPVAGYMGYESFTAGKAGKRMKKLTLSFKYYSELSEVNGRWVPSRVIHAGRIGSHNIRLNWDSVNPPVQEMKFDRMALQRAMTSLAEEDSSLPSPWP
ncbi:MAG: hypothetical protein AAF989_15230 [Planctomycetota bacterium]